MEKFKNQDPGKRMLALPGTFKLTKMGPARSTPGPWRVVPGGVVPCDDHLFQSGATICTTLHEANARLIAAAPDLLDALRDLVESIERAAGAGVDMSGHIGVGDALAAIRKAEGRS